MGCFMEREKLDEIKMLYDKYNAGIISYDTLCYWIIQIKERVDTK